ncbi:reverse transcriptase family protein [Microbulbifer sp. TRSA002]|uniref:reverse transcriptase family protein n=1 Tax=Microbulbifer sp. TRSA002 TaxID=3243382 RepID=UPI004039FF36
MADKPYYPHKSIGSLDVLSKTLGIRPKLLLDLSNKISDSYTEFNIVSKSGKCRTVYDPKYELKKLQKRINSRIFENVIFPEYLQGGIKDKDSKRDYVNNAAIHEDAKILISIDIKRFFDNIRPVHVSSIFKNFLRFPPDISDLLTKIVTLGDKVPQGACTSTYIANLLFFNTEYQIVSELRNKGISYSRLLDDVTLSSPDSIPEKEVSGYIKKIAGMFRKYDLKVNNKKTKIEYRKHSKDRGHFKVTGVWVGGGQPRLRRKDRDYIRHLVYICEREYEKSPESEAYHELWNKVSGLVAKMKRLGHKQSGGLRKRLAKILPRYDDNAKKKIVMDAKKLLNVNKRRQATIGFSKQLGKVHYQLGVLARTDKGLAKDLRKNLKGKFNHLPTKKEQWL